YFFSSCPLELQKGKEKARRKGDLKEEAALCNQLGGLLARHGRFQEALQEHRQELHLLESADDVIGCAVAHRKIGECLAELESYEAALKHQRRHLELACSLSSHVEQQRAWATIGRTYMFMAESEPASEALREAENAFMRSLAVLEEKLQGTTAPFPQREVSEMTARLYLNLGLVYDSLKNPAKYTYYIKKSIYISEQAQLHEDLYRAYFNLGNIHLREGEHSKAMRCLERARECACKMSEKCMESECCAGIAQVLLSLGDFTAAKRALKKAYRLGSQQPQQRESICRSLPSKVSSLQQALEEAEASGQQRAALGLCEQLGDLFSKAGDYPRAVEAYEKQLSHAQALKRPEQELAVIHVSLAATFGDLKDHARAVEHYRAELALRQGNPLERGKTWLNIALAKEESRESYEELKPCFESALQCAEQASDPRLQRQILQHLHASQQRCECPEAADTLVRLQDLCRAQGWRSDGEASEDEDWQDSEPVEASELELSSSGEGEEDGASLAPRRCGRVPGEVSWNQRNDKGETLLHRACIDGNLRQVRFFVEKGHPLNPRDYCGWTPLHEACNHGHLEIVRFLLDHGAAVDDPGGPGCEGITPLHDALNCGHFDVAELLVERGASVLLCNAKGLTPLGTLQAWVQLFGRDLDRETRQRSEAMEQLLRKAMAGSRAPLQQSQPASQLFDAELPESPTSCPPGPALVPHSPRGSPQEPEEGCVSPRKPVRRLWPLGRKPAREEESPVGAVGEQVGPGPAASAEYRAAMRGVGSAHSRHPPSPGGPTRPPGPALIPSEEYVGDDWLEDDLGPRPHSRKRGRQSPAGAAGAGAGSAESTASESDEGASRQPPELTRKRRRRVRQSRLSQMVARALPGRVWGTGAEGRPEAPADAGRLQGASGGSSRVNGVPEHEECPPPGPTQVSFEWHVLGSAPLPCSESEGRPVSWLAEQASQRYYQSCGLLPRLTLKKEGALLAPQDRVVDVLQSNEEVLAEVQSWDLPPLVERYRKACRNLAVGEHRLLLKVLERQEAGPSFSVSGVTLRRLHLAPLFRALKLQASIRRLCLSGTGLGDDAAEELLASVGTMPGLTQLDLSANRLGPEGLHKLANGLSASAQRLDELDLSLNPLGDRSAQPLAALLCACPVLAVLRLQGCGFTSALLQRGRVVQLRSLSMSHNVLGASGLDLLLKSLPWASVTHLEIGSVGAGPEDRQPLQEALGGYLAQEDCALSRLTFSGNHLDDAAVAELARCLPRCPALVALDLSANRAVGTAGLQALLRALDERGHGLQFLSLAGESALPIPSRGSQSGPGGLDAAPHRGELQLCSRSVSRGDQRAVAELWQGPAGTTLHSVTRHHKLFCQCR
uniref:Tonsoku-like protein n=1 Tax=Varanus komodoensis TaxID=61221 RepID=A0A8D2KSB0_VARKO